MKVEEQEGPAKGSYEIPVPAERAEVLIKSETYIVFDEVLTLCILRTQSGFFIIGKSAAFSLDGYDEDEGKRRAYDDCIRQLSSFEGYAWLDKMLEAQACEVSK